MIKKKKHVFLTFLIGLLLSFNVFGQLEMVTERMIVTENGATISGKHFNVQGKVNPTYHENPAWPIPSLVDGQTYERGYQCLVIDADNVTVENCFFENTGWAILVTGGHTNITIKSNRFENVGTAVRAPSGTTHLTVQYNEVRGVGVLDNTETSNYDPWNESGSVDHCKIHWYWSSNFVQVSNGDNLNVSYNIVDNKDLDSRWLEDFINFYGNVNNTLVKGNKIRGTSNLCMVSGTGGAIISDCIGSNHMFEDNIVVRASGYGIASAGGSNLTIQNNYSYYPKDHGYAYTTHPHWNQIGGSYAYGNFIYGGRPCGTNNKLLNNHGFSISSEANPDGGCNAIVHDYTWNVYDPCGWVEKSGNVWPSSDPGWDDLLPDDMFADLTCDYFSGKGGDYEAPAAPTGLSAVAAESITAISLSWSENTESDFVSYNVKRSDTENGIYVNIATGVTDPAYVDSNLIPETTYYYAITAIDTVKNESVFSVVVSADSTPVLAIETVQESEFILLQQNRPNPFSSETIIGYELKEPGFVELQIIDVTGRVVSTLEHSNKQSGSYEVKWNANSKKGGIYFYKLTVSSSKGAFRDNKKMIIVR